MGRPLEPGERQAIIDDLQAGKSVNRTAKDHGRAASTVSKIGREAGIDSLSNAHSRLARAHEARRSYGAERRAERLAVIANRIDRILERMAEPHMAFSFGGKDNDYNEHEFPEPTTDALKAYAGALAQLTRAEMEIVKYDEKSNGDASDVDRWLEHMLGGE